MNKKSVILFVSFLFMLGVFLVTADVGTVSYTKAGDGYEVSGWTKGGVSTSINITVPASGGASPGATITNITILLDTANYTWVYVSLNGDAEMDNNTYDSGGNANITYNALGALLDWNCTNISQAQITCSNNTDETALNSSLSDNSSLTILLNITGVSDGLESISINWTVLTGGPGSEPEVGNNASSFTTSTDDQQPRLLNLNITDGSLTLSNGTNFTNYFLDSGSTLTVYATIVDLKLSTPVYLYCSGNTTASQGDGMGQEVVSILQGAQSITGVAVTGTTSYFTTTIPTTCIQDGNVTSFFLVANDSLGHLIQFNNSVSADTEDELFMVMVNGTVNPKIILVNVTDTFTDSESNSYRLTLTSTSGLTGNSFLGPRNLTFTTEISGDQKSYTNVTLVFNNESRTMENRGNGMFGYVNDTVFMTNLTTAENLSAADGTKIVLEASIDLSSYVDNSSIEFYILANNTDGNYTAISGPYRFELDTSAPNEPTMTPPTDRTIAPRGSITYTCESSDGKSGVQKMKWKLTKPDGNTVNKAFADTTTSKQSVTFTGDETAAVGIYTLECTALDNAGNEIVHQSTTGQTFTVLSSAVTYGGEPGAEGGVTAPTFDLDFSTSDEANLKVPQGTIKTLTFDGKTEHQITFKEITATSATLEISSTPTTITLIVGETKNVDVNGDGTNDLVVKLNSIINDKADVTITKIKEGAELIVKQEASSPSTEQPPAGEQPPAKEVTPPEVEEQGGSSAWIWITLIVIIAVVAVGYFLLKKKK